MAFVSDTFTDSDGTSVTSHTGETGATWTNHPSYTNGAKIQNNRAHGNGEYRVLYASGAPASADYDVEAVVRKVTGLNHGGIIGRCSTSTNTYYAAVWENAGPWWRLYKLVSGTSTSLGTYSDNPAEGTDRTVKLQMRGTAIKVFVDGTERISVTDSAISDAGRAGIRLLYGSATTGYHVDSITATDAVTTVTGDAALSGTGTLDAAGTRTTFGEATLSGTGTLSAAAGAQTHEAGVTLSGTGTLDATGTRTTLGAAALSGSGTLTSAGARTTFGAAALTGSGTFAAASGATIGAAALSGSGTLDAAGVRTAVTAAALSGSGVLAAAGVRQTLATASLPGTGVLGADGWATVTAGAGLLGTGVLAAAGQLRGSLGYVALEVTELNAVTLTAATVNEVTLSVSVVTDLALEAA